MPHYCARLSASATFTDTGYVDFDAPEDASSEELRRLALEAADEDRLRPRFGYEADRAVVEWQTVAI